MPCMSRSIAMTPKFQDFDGGDTNKLKLALMFQMAFPGAPAIYYGDEIGMEGEKTPIAGALSHGSKASGIRNSCMGENAHFAA